MIKSEIKSEEDKLLIPEDDEELFEQKFIIEYNDIKMDDDDKQILESLVTNNTIIAQKSNLSDCDSSDDSSECKWDVKSAVTSDVEDRVNFQNCNAIFIKTKAPNEDIKCEIINNSQLEKFEKCETEIDDQSKNLLATMRQFSVKVPDILKDKSQVTTKGSNEPITPFNLIETGSRDDYFLGANSGVDKDTISKDTYTTDTAIPEQSLFCSGCFTKFRSRSHLLQHQQYDEHGEKIFKCSRCCRHYVCKYSLMKHIEKEHVNPKYSLRHTLICRAKSRHSIPELEQSLACSGCFTKSHRTSELEQSLICSGCLTKFRFRLDLLQHQEYDEKIFECSHCRRRCVCKDSLMKHIEEEHANPKHVLRDTIICRVKSQPIADTTEQSSCKRCFKIFHSRSDLFDHLKYEKCKETFKCYYCERRWSNKHILQRHIATNHVRPENLKYSLRYKRFDS